MNSFFLTHKNSIIAGTIGTTIGAIGGFMYWKFVGCIDGTCAIWSNPTRATLYGAIMGGLLLLAFVPENKKSEKL